MIKNPKDLKLGVGLAGFCLFCLFFLIPNQVGGFTEAASLLPVLIVLFILMLSILLIVSSLRLEAADANEVHTGNKPKPSTLFLVIGIMIAYAWSLDIIGFLLSSLLAMVSLFLIFGVREYKRIALITFITLAVLYISFEKLLVAPLPVGTLIETFFD
jgi:hypothetical protein